MDNLKPLFVTSLLGMLLVLAGGCGGGVEDDTQEAPIGDITDTWKIKETSSPDPCSPFQSEYYLDIYQNGNNLTVKDKDNNTFSGTISGNSVSWTGSYDDTYNGGTTTINSLTATIASDCRSMSGRMSWTWKDDPRSSNDSCSGTTEFDGIRGGFNGC